MSTETRGLWGWRPSTRSMAAAMSREWMPSGGTKAARAASMPSSCSTHSSACSKLAASAEAIMSTGLRTEASAGRRVRSRSWVRADSSTTSRSWVSAASAAMMPGPPALVTMASRLPRGRGWWAKAMATSNSASTLGTRRAPAWAMSASVASSVPASAPVWLAAARCPAPVRPDFTMHTGLTRLTSRQISTKRAGLPKLSRYMSTTRVAGSSRQNSSRSLPLTSARLPMDTKLEMPMPSRQAFCRMLTPMAPDWLMKATGPGGGMTGAKVALSEYSGSVLSTPRQLGPTRRMPASRTRSSSLAWRSAPSPSVSPKPAEMTTSPRTPAAAHCSATPSTCCLGTTTTARSTGPGSDSSEGQAGIEWIDAADGFTG